MAEAAGDPRCKHQLHYDGGGYLEPSSICSCPAGLVHMHDCPVTLGLPCVHHADHGGEPTRAPAAELDSLHGRLMEDFLSQAYRHRVRSLQPQGDAWMRRRDELAELHEAGGAAESADGEPSERQQAEDERYEREKERLIAQRKQREEQRAAQEEKIREELAAERARRGIKTVVERARESVAAQGNVATSWLDAVELPGGATRRSRRGRGRKGGGGAGDAAPAEAGGTGRKRGRRRGRGKGPRPAGEGGAAPAPGEGQAGGQPPSGAPGSGKKRRRRRRRRGGGEAGGAGGGAGGGTTTGDGSA